LINQLLKAAAGIDFNTFIDRLVADPAFISHKATYRPAENWALSLGSLLWDALMKQIRSIPRLYI